MPEFAVIATTYNSALKTEKLSEDHLGYLKKLKEEGKLEFAGRFTDGQGGFYVLNVSVYEEAEKIAQLDPYNASGYRKYVIRGWERRL